MTADTSLYQQPWPEGEYRFFQLGFVVDDLLGTAERWTRVHGVGPFHVTPPIEAACTYRGTESAVHVQTAFAQAGPVQIELIEQLCDRPSAYRDLFAKGESGFHQLCTLTPDYHAKRAHFDRLGYEVASEFDSVWGWVGYFDTFADFGFITEVVEDSPAIRAQMKKIADACATWDGTDPIRRITRDV